ncbi:MAG: 3'-5' exonuclease [Sulfobacillus acidophilus]|uniref:3'-5' exonuclease n=1 Tax=Sulfobacillus acidophilus TaxID=53633 RepID=A0A2T2WI64_9FIRM|nr:MAG: 3'-5' exonuclease [Sulfobacillus acidophilus]
MRYWMVFDIETIPDASIGRRWLNVEPTCDDAEVRRRMLAARREQTGQESDFLKPPFHQVVAIAAALIDEEGILRRLGPLGQPHDSEPELLRAFFHAIESLGPRLVGWNTSGFDLPTLVYRAMRHHLAIPAFYHVGEPYHGYRKRYDEESHLDLMDILSGYGASARVSLDEAAMLLGVPGKLEVDGRDVVDLFEGGDIDRIRQYCSHDVLTTTLIFLAYAHHRGWLSEDAAHTLSQSAWRWICEHDAEGWQTFRAAWKTLDAEIGRS